MTLPVPPEQFNFGQVNRWRLSLTIRAGLGVHGVADFDAPRFNFGDYFVADIFADWFVDEPGVDELKRVVVYAEEYYELPTQNQRELGSNEQSMDAAWLENRLRREYNELRSFELSQRNFALMGELSEHQQDIEAALKFVQEHGDKGIFVVASKDD